MGNRINGVQIGSRKKVVNSDNWNQQSLSNRKRYEARIKAAGLGLDQVIFLEVDGGDITAYRLHLNHLGVHASGHCDGVPIVKQNQYGTYTCSCGIAGTFGEDNHRVCTEAAVI
jgi:hypothetical protein